jgi:mannonate dehydratase
MKMIESMRWFGAADPVSLQDIAQAGCTGVVSALHRFAPGEVWPYEDIVSYKKHIESFNLKWEVVESLPVHDYIKMGYEDRDQLIENYISSLRNLAKAGVNIITFNFMPLLDWLRTNVNFRTETKTEILYFSKKDYSVFDLFILKRASALAEYSEQELSDLKQYFDTFSEEQIATLSASLLMALPGTDEDFTLDYLRKKLAEYAHLTEDQLRDNLVYFLDKICPVADEMGVYFTIHPDDPPFAVFGLPRIASTYEDFQILFESVPNPSNGLCFCTGSLGARVDNELMKILKAFGSRVRFLHLRNTKRLENGDFFEADHLYGDADMYQIIKEIAEIMKRENRSIVMRPDHGAKMMDDMNKVTYPGYSAIGRLKGLAELRGLEYAILKQESENN